MIHEKAVPVGFLADRVVVALPYECYSIFQRQLREAFSDYTVVVMNDTNGAAGSYLYPPDEADERVYQVWVSPYTGDALTVLTESCIAEIGKWLESTT